MVTYNFNLAFFAYSDFNVGARTQGTVSYPNGTIVSLDAGASPVVVNVTDDDGNPAGSPDNEFSDGFIDVPGDGSSPSTANNDQVLTNPVTVNGTNYAAGDQVELEFAFTTTSGETFWIIRIDGVNVGISGPALPEPGTTYEVASSADGSESAVTDVPCFLKGTQIATPKGLLPVEDLSVGDLVETLDHGPKPIRWIAGSELTEKHLEEKPNLRPIRIRAGALGENRPRIDLVVSPQHRVLVRSKIARRMFETDEVLVPAKKLLGVDGVAVDWGISPVWYFHFRCDDHEVIFANGACAETLYLGPQAVRSLGSEALAELFAVFGTRVVGEQSFAHPVPPGKQIKKLIARHQKNHKMLFAG